MSYEAIVARIRNIRKLKNADKLNLATCSGYQIIVGKDQEENQLGIFFPTDGQLSHEHCMFNRLYRKDPSTGKPIGGLFEENRRVKMIKIRGEYSTGFWQPIESLAWCGNYNFKEGDTFTSINGKEICRKYITPATQKQYSQNKSKDKKYKNKPRDIIPTFHEHFNTKQLRLNLHRIPEGALIYITTKLHGTSQRTGYHLVSTTGGNWWQKFIRKFRKPKWNYISGTRKTIMNRNFNGGFYKNTTYRQTIHSEIVSIGLYKNETLYYEVVGYQDNGSPIMGIYNTEDKDIIKQYGDNIVFKYGCSNLFVDSTDEYGMPDQLRNLFKIYIYRITMTNPSGIEIEYSWEQVKKRCKELGLSHVPEIDRIVFKDTDSLLEKCKEWTSGPDTIDKDHPIEGIVLRVEDENCFEYFKYKGDIFCDLEGIRKNSDYFIDEEESN